MVESTSKERTVAVEYIFGESGTGKTRSVYDHYRADGIYVVRGNDSSALSQYENERVLLIDNFASEIPFGVLAPWLESSPLPLETPHGKIWEQWDRVVLIGRKSPNRLYRSSNGRSTISAAEREKLLRLIDSVTEFSMDGVKIQHFAGSWRFDWGDA